MNDLTKTNANDSMANDIMVNDILFTDKNSVFDQIKGDKMDTIFSKLLEYKKKKNLSDRRIWNEIPLDSTNFYRYKRGGRISSSNKILIKQYLEKQEPAENGKHKEKQKSSLLLKHNIRHYVHKAREIKSILKDNPKDWGKYQAELTQEINNVFYEISKFEQKCLQSGAFQKIEKFKKMFVKRFQKTFLAGEYVKWSLSKPYGYPGDFKIIDNIYLNNPATQGFPRLFDNYFQSSAISIAVRNRKEDFKRMILENIPKDNCRIMSLASGPAREIHELLTNNKKIARKITFDCYDIEPAAHKHAKTVIGRSKNVNYIIENALRIAGAKDINSRIPQKYHIIYSTGLFDYLNEKITEKLLINLKKLLHKNGKLIIADVRNKYYNPSVHFMEWIGEWNLLYRSDEEFKSLFLRAGFNPREIDNRYEQQGILQYIIATNS